MVVEVLEVDALDMEVEVAVEVKLSDMAVFHMALSLVELLAVELLMVEPLEVEPLEVEPLEVLVVVAV